VGAAGIGAGGDDAEISARLRERVWIDVGLGGGRLGSSTAASFASTARCISSSAALNSLRADWRSCAISIA